MFVHHIENLPFVENDGRSLYGSAHPRVILFQLGSDKVRQVKVNPESSKPSLEIVFEITWKVLENGSKLVSCVKPTVEIVFVIARVQICLL